MADLPARGPVSAVLVRAHLTVTCSCGTAIDAFLDPGRDALHSCEGCGTVYHLRLTCGPGEGTTLIAAGFTAEAREEEGGTLTPDQARRAEFRRSLRSGTGESTDGA